MTRVSISLGAHAIPAVKAALAHAAANPAHNPIVVFDGAVAADPAGRFRALGSVENIVSWVCFGEERGTQDPSKLCAGGNL